MRTMIDRVLIFVPFPTPARQVKYPESLVSFSRRRLSGRSIDGAAAGPLGLLRGAGSVTEPVTAEPTSSTVPFGRGW